MGVDVERVGGAIALPCEVGDDGAGAHGVDPELVRFTDDDVGVAHGGGRGNSVADGVVEVEVGELGLGEQRCGLGVVVEPDADIEPEAVPEREGESLGVEHEAVQHEGMSSKMAPGYLRRRAARRCDWSVEWMLMLQRWIKGDWGRVHLMTWGSSSV